ncbi:helix-turn-helix transcriptional regulator [Burkholderia gladioli]|uniref:helix-turn-helix transcriptional regulator n=1 Tax=Burkholderia gladioli TaxID=28095 RepID=UPI003DA34F86
MNSRNKTSLPSSRCAASSGGYPASVTAQHKSAELQPSAGQLNTSAPSIEPYYLADEVCQYLKIGRTTLYKLVKSGELVPLRITARIRVWPLSTLKAFLASKEAK